MAAAPLAGSEAHLPRQRLACLQTQSCAWLQGPCTPSCSAGDGWQPLVCASDIPELVLPWLGRASQEAGVVHHGIASNYCENATLCSAFICIWCILTANKSHALERKQNSVFSSLFIFFLKRPDIHSLDTLLSFGNIWALMGQKQLDSSFPHKFRLLSWVSYLWQ